MFKENGIIASIIMLIKSLINTADSMRCLVLSIALLGIRICLVITFWKSGLTKIANWETTIFLFAEEYKVPVLPPELAAYFGTATELIAPIMLALGLGTRLGAIALLFMTAVIQFTYLEHIQHLYWAFACLMLIIHGSGLFGWDYFIRKKNMDMVDQPCIAGKTLSYLSVIILTIGVIHEILASIVQIDGMKPWLDIIIENFKM